MNYVPAVPVYVPAMGFNINQYGSYLGQSNWDLNYSDRPNSTLSSIPEVEMMSTENVNDIDLETLVNILISTARNGDLDIVSRFIRMLEAAVENL